MSEAPHIRILIVDDHPIVRAGLEAILNSQPDMHVIGNADNGQAAVKKARELRPDVILMDLRMPELSGVDAIQQIRDACNDTKILVLTTYDGDEDIHQALQAGASSYIVKGLPYEILLRAIRRVYAGKTFLPREVSNLLEAHPPEELSSQERRVLALIADGHCNRAIATELGITERTVKFHVSNILSYLGVEDRTQAVVVALRRGYVHLKQRSDEAPQRERG